MTVSAIKIQQHNKTWMHLKIEKQEATSHIHQTCKSLKQVHTLISRQMETDNTKNKNIIIKPIYMTEII